MIRVLALVILAVVAAGCNRGIDETTTTSSTAPEAGSTTTSAPDEEIDGPGEVVETTTTIPLIILDWTVALEGDGLDGKILVVEVPAGEATDRALENVILDVLEEYDPVERLDVVDDAEAVDLVRLEPDSLTEEEAAVVADHHLANYSDGYVTFTGPFEEVPGYSYGS